MISPCTTTTGRQDPRRESTNDGSTNAVRTVNGSRGATIHHATQVSSATATLASRGAGFASSLQPGELKRNFQRCDLSSG